MEDILLNIHKLAHEILKQVDEICQLRDQEKESYEDELKWKSDYIEKLEKRNRELTEQIKKAPATTGANNLTTTSIPEMRR